jgi:hypothetical protein
LDSASIPSAASPCSHSADQSLARVLVYQSSSASSTRKRSLWQCSECSVRASHSLAYRSYRIPPTSQPWRSLSGPHSIAYRAQSLPVLFPQTSWVRTECKCLPRRCRQAAHLAHLARESPSELVLGVCPQKNLWCLEIVLWNFFPSHCFGRLLWQG